MIKRSFENNDIYFIHTFSNGYTIVNNNYNSLAILDQTLGDCEILDFGRDILFDDAFTAEYQVLFTCYDENVFLHYNFVTNSIALIPMAQYSNVFFLNQYHYENGHFYLFFGDFSCIDVDTKNKTVNSYQKSKFVREHPELCELTNKPAYNFNLSAEKMIFRDDDTSIRIVDVLKNNVCTHNVESKSHAFDCVDGYYLEIGEELVKCFSQHEDFHFLPPENYMYMRGKLTKTLDGITLTLLSSDKRNSRNSQLERISLKA